MMAAAERTIFAIDGSKFGRKALALATPFDARLTLVTDRAPAASIAASVRAAKAALEVAETE